MACKLISASSQYLDTPYSADFDFGSGDFTVCWWDYLVSAVHDCSVLSNTHAGNDRGFNIGYMDTGTNKRNNFFSLNGTSWGVQLQHSSQPIGSWHHWAITRNGNTWVCYMDGNQDNSTVVAGTVNSTGHEIDIGYYQGGSTYFNGYITDIKIYKGTGLNAAFIKTIYESKGSDNITTNLKTRWLMNELPTGSNITSCIDISGNAHSLTSYNTPTYIESVLKLIK